MATVVAGAEGDAADQLSSCLQAGGIAIAPCDTIYGILGSVPATRSKIKKVKGREEGKPFIELYPSVESVMEKATQYVPGPLLDLWPGALTVILQTKMGKTAVRVPADAFLLKVLARTGPLYSTSVNKSGQPALWHIADIRTAFADAVDMIIDGGDLRGTPSTIIDISEKPFTIVRHGAVQLPPEVLQLCE